jgi:hypothetical protein
MSAKVIEVNFAAASAKRKDPVSPRFWPVVAVCSFGGSIICLIAGLVFSAFAGLEIVSASRTTAYISVGILLAAFVFAFLGAHTLDRNRSTQGDDRDHRLS